MTETPVAVTWQPKTTAGRDMILLVLSQQDGVVRDEKGFVTARMVELCGIPDTPNNRSMISNVLKLMEQDGYIIRDTRENKRTYEVVLETPVSEGRLEELRAALARNQKFFETPEQDVATPDDDSVHPDPTLARLITDCTRGLTVIQGAADKATRQTDAGRVVISVTGALRSIGIKGQWAREIRYYLRNLGLAKAIRKCEEDDKMWWWEVSDKSVNADALVALATGDDSFPNHLARQGKTYVEDGARERAFAGRAPAVLPSSLCSPVTVRKIGEPKEGSATPPPAEPAPSTDQIAALVRIIKGLEAQLASLRESHDATVAKMNADHAAELDKLQRQIDELKEAQASAAKVDSDAADVIARHAELL
jgi:hypothetical protein